MPAPAREKGIKETIALKLPGIWPQTRFAHPAPGGLSMLQPSVFAAATGCRLLKPGIACSIICSFGKMGVRAVGQGNEPDW